jgi:hypothetical protein
VTEFLCCSERSEWRVRNRLAWRTEGDRKIDDFTGRFIEDETMDKNIKLICGRPCVCLCQETVVAEFPYTALDIFLYKGAKTG